MLADLPFYEAFDGRLLLKILQKPLDPEFKEAHLLRIMETTKRLLADVGAEKMTIRGIAAASNVAPMTLYNRIGDKDTLIQMAVLDHYERNVKHGFFARSTTSGSPLERFLNGLKLLARTCLDNQSFVRALIGIYFRVGNKRDVPILMYTALLETWSELVAEMRRGGSLRDWVSEQALCGEMCERSFTVILKWAQDTVPDKSLQDHLVFGTLSLLVGASRGDQQIAIEAQLTKLSKKVSPPKAKL